MHKIVSAHENWETVLAPRIILGLWHPRFIKHAKEHMPYCTRSYIGGSPYIARKYFWEHCGAFSMWFAGLATVDGQRFIRECKAGNKHLMVWTVNERAQMMEVGSTLFMPSRQGLRSDVRRLFTVREVACERCVDGPHEDVVGVARRAAE